MRRSPFLSVFIWVHLWLMLPLLLGCGRSPAGSPGVAQPPPTVAQVPTAPPVGKAERRALIRFVERPCRIEAYAQTPILAKIAGYVKLFGQVRRPDGSMRAVDIGDEVQAGQLLAEIDVPELHEELKQKQAIVTQAAAEVEQAKQLLLAAEAHVATAVAAVAEAQAGRLKAQANHDYWQSQSQRVAQLVEQKAINEQNRDETLNLFRAAAAARVEVEARVRSTEAAKVESEAGRERARAEITVADAKARVAAAEEGRVRAMLGYTRLIAPFDGIITVRNTGIDVGFLLQPGGRETPLFVVTRKSPVRVFVEVPEDDAALVRPGAKAEVLVPALHGRKFAGAVTRSAWALEARSRTLLTEIDLPNPDGVLRPGQYANVAVTVVLPEAWVLPSAAVVKQGDAMVAFLVRDGKAVRVGVQAGYNDGKSVEIFKIDTAAQGAASPQWAEPTSDETFVLKAAGVTDGHTVEGR